MNTISTIVGPSITLVQPLVGSSLASDWARDFRNQTSCSTMFGHQAVVTTEVIDVLPLYMYNKGQ